MNDQDRFKDWKPKPESFDCGKCPYWGKPKQPCELCKGIR